MDQATSKSSGEMLDHVDKGVCENLSHLVEGVVANDAGAEHSLGDSVSVCGKDGTSEEMCNGQDIVDPPKINDTLHEVDQGTSYNSSNSVNGEVLETRVVIDSSAQIECVNGDNRKLEAKANESGLGKLSIKAPKVVSETDKNSCVIDMNCGNYRGLSENMEGEMICRICHLASGQPLEATAVGTPRSANNNSSTDLIMLGCACKDELGIAHSHCAEAWFKIKGNRFLINVALDENRIEAVGISKFLNSGNAFIALSFVSWLMLCEICGETAKNVTDVTDNGFRFMEEWSESGFIDNGRTSSRRLVGCWRGQPFCNFLMACLVIAFVLPWFFRVNMF